MALLFEQIEGVFCNEFNPAPRPEIPSLIIENLKHQLRPYQVSALQNFIFLLNHKPRNHLLFHMATGSGKTMIIASTILHLYAQGYRNFIFFVNTTNIILKTRDNLANGYSAKYLFTDKIVIDNQAVNINIINGSFEDARSDDINIFFTTMQGLHTSLTTLKENGITYSDFEDNKLVLIADEAHHLNNANANERSWWQTVQNLLKTNDENILLEFTATAKLHNDYYNDKIIYDYPLKKFRDDKFSKEVKLLSSNFSGFEELDDKILRMLQAVIISEYRKMIAEKHSIALKPVVMFKNKSTKQADENYALFRKLIDKLEAKHIDHVLSHSDSESIIVKIAGEIVDRNAFAQRLKIAFSSDKTVLIYGTSADKEQVLKNLNEMEAPHNHIRAIFAVEILNEGWDVLNLFDIVKLDEAPQKSNTTTTKEAQLIGRGARYYPFALNDDEKYKRKFDNDLGNELRILEEMMFHSINESRYIATIKAELTKSGIADFDKVDETTVKMKLKESFKVHPYFVSGGILVNKRLQKDKTRFNSIKDYISNFGDTNPTLKLSNSAIVTSGFDERPSEGEKNLIASTLKLSDISLYTVRSAINKSDFFYFSNLKRYFPHLRSIHEFMSNADYLGGIAWTVYSDSALPQISEYEKRKAVMNLLEAIKKGVLKNNFDFEGSREFCSIPLKDRLGDKTLKVKPHPNAEGMRRHNPPLFLEQIEWYVYDENYGTSEEMDFVLFFDQHYNELSQKYDDIRLIRNEKAYHIYSFDSNGQRFEPDFIILLRSKNEGVLHQVFIEPKGEHLKLADGWKEEFLLSLDKATLCANVDGGVLDGKYFKIHGLPFYNSATQNSFSEKFTETLMASKI
jgi:type III restriction enzyme